MDTSEHLVPNQCQIRLHPDLNYAKQAIAFMEKSNWKDAKKVANKAKDKSIYNFIQWRHLLRKGNLASYYEYKTFLDRINVYP